MDVISILEQYGIEYRTSGKNISANHVGIPCPYCGDDPSQHLGIDLNNGSWNCWRNQMHKSSKLEALLVTIAGITKQQAKKVVEDSNRDTSNFLEKVYAKLGNKKQSDKASLILPSNFYLFEGKREEKRASNYLVTRGFPLETHKELSELYGIRYCYSGKYADRIIFPLYHKGHLLSWTARSFYDNVEKKYDNLPAYESIRTLPNSLWNYDKLKSDCELSMYPTVYICEGAIDALKIDYYSDCFATCIFGLNFSERQISLLMELPKRTKFVFVLDNDAAMKMPQMQSKFPQRNTSIFVLKDNDPGSMSRKTIKKLFNVEKV